jgi:hypothetical protein
VKCGNKKPEMMQLATNNGVNEIVHSFKMMVKVRKILFELVIDAKFFIDESFH